MIYNNITFDGCHCRDHMGLIYVPDKPEKIIAPQTVYGYTVGGVPGTVACGDQQTMEAYNLSGTFYPAMDIDDEAAARRLWRKIAQWLGVGRRQLVMDSEPDKYIIAEVQAMDNDEYGWIDGGLHVTWLCQPYHWLVTPDSLKVTLPSSTSGLGVTIRSWCVETSLPAPVNVVITNEGEIAITGVRIAVGTKTIAFEGMELLPGEQLEVSMMTPIGAVIIATDGEKRSAMEYATIFEYLVNPGMISVSGIVTYAEAVDGGAASCQLKAHGCWR